MSNIKTEEKLTEAFKEVKKRLDATQIQGQKQRKLVYVTRAELLANAGVTSFGNNVEYRYTFKTPFKTKPYLNVVLDLIGMRLQYIFKVTAEGFSYAANYGADIMGLWYEAEELE